MNMKPNESSKGWLIATALLACVTCPATGAIAAEPQPWEVGAGVGWLDPASKRNLDGGAAVVLTFGLRFDNAWGAEILGMQGKNDAPVGTTGSDMAVLGLRGLYHFYNRSSAWTPYLSFGAGNTDLRSADNETSALVGAGLKYALNDNFSLRGEVNAHYGFDSKATDLSLFVGVTYQWGKARAPAPAPVAVPAAVAAVPPPPPPDTDGDGVPDNRDKCPGTPRGVKVDATGCPQDSDGDGVPDYLDQCPNTPRGTKVDATGCPMKLTERVSIKLEVHFDTGKADIKPQFSTEVKRLADFMRQYSTTKVVIEGHTDNVGGTGSNQKLSERRAQAVAQSLVRDHGIASDRVQSVGYGTARPIADNKTADGRATNRRVIAQIEETVTRNR
jgi:OOP family OmpA-OmpF porin